MPYAVAVDLGASSGRIALGELDGEEIRFQIVKQIHHEATERNGRLYWNLDLILELCREASALAAKHPSCTLGIDSWGVDHGFIGHDGKLLDDPVCYRDLSHLKAFESLAPYRRELYSLTGTQHQPFNTICQLAARKEDQPDLFERTAGWMILPDLLGYLLGGRFNSELTQASTTQLLGLDGRWSARAFEIVGWPVPDQQPVSPGKVVGQLPNGVDLVSVGSHDTASAVLGFGELGPSDMFLNVGTWSLAGCILGHPISTQRCEELGFTNERTVDNQIRFLKNIPGFYFINRLHEELEITTSVPDWLKTASITDQSLDLFRPEFFNPDSMRETCETQLSSPPKSSDEWAGISLTSLARAVRQTAAEIHEVAGISVSRVRVGGGGSQSREFCQTLARAVGVPVEAGPAESTVLGNLAAQFLAQGCFSNWDETRKAISTSLSLDRYEPKPDQP